LEISGGHDGGEESVCSNITGFLRWAKIQGRGDWQVGGDGLGGLQVLLLHTEVAFAGSERLGEVLGNERGSEARPGVKMATLDGPKEGGRQWTERAGMQIAGEVLLRA
jgi:hypothetical protein